jgi:hypothetical protein
MEISALLHVGELLDVGREDGDLNVTNPQGAAALYVRILLRCSLAECGSPSPRPAPVP